MALLYIDGFEMGDHAFRYASIGGSLSFQTGANTRFNYGRCVSTASGIFCAKALPTPVTRLITGLAFRCDLGNDSVNVVQFAGDGGATNHMNVRIMASGALGLFRASTQVAITAGALFSFSVWHYLEASTTISDTVGVAKVRLDGVEVLSFTGDTRNAGTLQSVDTVTIQAMSTGNAKMDDWYISDDTGSAPYNDFLGDVRVCTLSPTAAGATTQLTPSVAPNWGCVDEQPYSATDFVTGALAALKDTYAMQDLPAGITVVHGVQPGVVARKSDAGARSVKTVVRSGGADYSDASAQPLGTSDGWYRSLRLLNPNGSVAWTPASVNAMEVGVEVA